MFPGTELLLTLWKRLPAFVINSSDRPQGYSKKLVAVLLILVYMLFLIHSSLAVLKYPAGGIITPASPCIGSTRKATVLGVRELPVSLEVVT